MSEQMVPVTSCLRSQRQGNNHAMRSREDASQQRCWECGGHASPTGFPTYTHNRKISKHVDYNLDVKVSVTSSSTELFEQKHDEKRGNEVSDGAHNVFYRAEDVRSQVPTQQRPTSPAPHQSQQLQQQQQLHQQHQQQQQQPQLQKTKQDTTAIPPASSERCAGNHDRENNAGILGMHGIAHERSHELSSLHKELEMIQEKLNSFELALKEGIGYSDDRCRDRCKERDRDRNGEKEVEQVQLQKSQDTPRRANSQGGGHNTVEERVTNTSHRNGGTGFRRSCGYALNARNNTLKSQQRNLKDIISINVGGVVHQTYRTTLENIPDTRLTWLARESARNAPEYNAATDEFFFDRHPQVFSHILNYYRTGKLHIPYDVCGPTFEEELVYWGIDVTQVESCCWLNFRQHKDAQETLKDFEGIEFDCDPDDESEVDLSKYGFSVDQSPTNNLTQTWYQRWQPYVWKLTEDPQSSRLAKGLTFIRMALITLSTMFFCLETLPYFKDEKIVSYFVVIEGICVIYFTIELITRFVFCNNKVQFVRDVMNWIDLLASVPFIIDLIAGRHLGIPILQSVRVIRVFRIIRLSKHSTDLQILGHTLRASIRELGLLIFFLIMGIVIFSSLLYYSEENISGTKFVSIPHTFWWSVITMTTVGYGDMVPETLVGRVIGSVCSVCGVLMIALPVPVIVNNFNIYYSHAQARLKLPKKRRNMLCGAANALKSSAFYSENQNGNENDEQDDITSSVDQGDAVSLPNDEQDLYDHRMKAFERRESTRFNSLTTGSPGLSPRLHNGYAQKKRRSLLPMLPTIDVLSDVE